MNPPILGQENSDVIGQLIRHGKQHTRQVAIVPLANVDTGGGVVSWANPLGKAIMVKELTLDVRTVATGACTLDAGPAAAATTVNDTLIDGLDVNSATGVFSNVGAAGSNGNVEGQRLEAAEYLTVSVKTGASAGLVGVAIIEYIELDA